MVMHLVEYHRDWPRDTTDAVLNLGLLDTTVAALSAVKFAAYQHITADTPAKPIRLAFQGWVDVAGPAEAIASTAIATAFDTARTQLGLAAPPAWTDWRASTATPAPA